jgi:hypothetical protein
MSLNLFKNLKSPLWSQDLKDVEKNPYDHENYRTFYEEASFLLDKAYELYDAYNLKFDINERSLNKCIWMLQLDALDALRDCIFLLKIKKHRLPGKMFRDITESLDLAYLIKNEPNLYLEKWFNDEFIPHKKYREYVGQKYSKPLQYQEGKNYEALSTWTHHNYYPLKNSYTLSGDHMTLMVYDSHCPDFLVPHETTSQYLWMIKYLIKKFIKNMYDSGLFQENTIMNAFKIENT